MRPSGLQVEAAGASPTRPGTAPPGWNPEQFAEKLFELSLRAKRSNLIQNKIKENQIAASLTLLAMTSRMGFSRKLLKGSKEKGGFV
jgi:hypothetical protein